MTKKISAIVIGIGEQGSVGLRALANRGVEILGVCDTNPALVGRDAGECVGIAPLGVTVTADLNELLSRCQPDVALCAHASELAAIESAFTALAKHHINIATVSTDSYFPWRINREIADRLDACFQENGVTCFASGIQDVFWSGIGLEAASACNRIESIDLRNTLPLEICGLVVAEEFLVGKTKAEFEKFLAGIDVAKNDSVIGPLMALYSNCDVMGLHPLEPSIELMALYADKDLYQPQWDFTIKKGTMTGQRFTVDLPTREGLLWKTSMTIKVLEPEKGEKPCTEFVITGEPNLHIDMDDIHGEITTICSAVNRIPQILAAEPGFKTIRDLGRGEYFL